MFYFSIITFTHIKKLDKYIKRKRGTRHLWWGSTWQKPQPRLASYKCVTTAAPSDKPRKPRLRVTDLIIDVPTVTVSKLQQTYFYQQCYINGLEFNFFLFFFFKWCVIKTYMFILDTGGFMQTYIPKTQIGFVLSPV